MTDEILYTLILIVCIIGLVELVIASHIRNTFGFLGAAGTLLTGMAIKNQHWGETIVFIALVLICGVFFATTDKDVDKEAEGFTEL